MHTSQAFANFFRLQDRYRLLDLRRFEIQEERDSHQLQITQTVWCFHGRTGQDARAPRLLPQMFGKARRKFFQLVDVGRLTKKRKGQFTCLLEIAIEKLQALDRPEISRQDVKHIAVELDACNESCDAYDTQRDDSGPN